ncbi:uncharacterized protein VICG_00315 [Vittaforma corneae ATCC 50505]|uniref:SWIM-type domain-containing protein n=1 Tax=Vittaforma corneae (strain ATCC 50505) TaxID=993615 RepID=L2GNV2_VITCO|nr:uncharacterized protein VICG_00315 [Vittaforma corneae ATCC 50505]ELA42563.1 hypothetical protein VICG_00315 [Vittaforma corneae ATCC 50505]
MCHERLENAPRLRENKIPIRHCILPTSRLSMDYSNITREMVYLCIGEDLELLDSSELYCTFFKGIKYFIAGTEKVIRGDSQIFCSCNERYCWHIFKVVLDEDRAIIK